MEDTIITFNSRTLWLRPDGDDSTLRLHLRTVEGQVSFVFITSTNRHIHGLTFFFFFIYVTRASNISAGDKISSSGRRRILFYRVLLQLFPTAQFLVLEHFSLQLDRQPIEEQM